MLFEEVTQVLDALDHSRVRHWVGGGWGVDMLVARQPGNIGISISQSTPLPFGPEAADFHAGYEHQAKDTLDLAQLNALNQP